MIVIAGLGNPGNRYSKTRHNAGFLAVDMLLTRADLPTKWRRHASYESVDVTFDGVPVRLVKPLTFMNGSGKPIADIVHADHVALENVWLVYDDVTVPLGSFRIRPVGGSSGGHNGVESVIQQVGSGEFGRIRIGIGPMPENTDLAKYVLHRFGLRERSQFRTVLDSLTDYMVASIRYKKLKEETIHV